MNLCAGPVLIIFNGDLPFLKIQVLTLEGDKTQQKKKKKKKYPKKPRMLTHQVLRHTRRMNIIQNADLTCLFSILVW